MGNFYGRNDSTLWGYKKQHFFYPIDKYQTKGFNGGAHWGLTKIEYKGKRYSRGAYDWCVHSFTLKEKFQHEVLLWEPDSLEKAFRLVRKLKERLWKRRILPLTI